MKPIIGKKKPYLYDGIEHASKEEIYFRWYLDDLKSAGIVISFEFQPRAWVLSDGQKVDVLLKGKTVKRVLFKPKTYTPDYFILFNGKHSAVAAFYEDLEKQPLTGKPAVIPFLGKWFCCSVDIKPKFEKQNSKKAVFTLKQAWVWQLYKIYVAPVIYQKLFEQTFTPDRFLLTDKSGKFRVINYPVRTLHDYTHSKAAV